MAPPMQNMMNENTRYSVPMSLWFVVKTQRVPEAVRLVVVVVVVSVGGVRGHGLQPLELKLALRRGDGRLRCSGGILGGVGGLPWPASHCSNSALGLASTTIGMKPWS